MTTEALALADLATGALPHANPKYASASACLHLPRQATVSAPEKTVAFYFNGWLAAVAGDYVSAPGSYELRFDSGNGTPEGAVKTGLTVTGAQKVIEPFPTV